MDEQTNLVPEWMEGKKINECKFRSLSHTCTDI